MNPVLQALAIVPMALAARLRRLERRTITQVSRAATADAAVSLRERGAAAQFVQHRLHRAGVLLDAGNGRYYFSKPAYDRFRRNRRKRALVLIGIVLIGMAVLYWRGDIS